MRCSGRGLPVLLLGLGILGTLCLLPGAAHARTVSEDQSANCSNGLALTTSASVGTAPLLVTFQLTSYWGAPVVANWSFGTGAHYSGSGANYLSPTYRYIDVGNYLASVEVTAPGRSGACSEEIQVTPPPLVATANASPDRGVAPLTVHLSATVSGGTGIFSTVRWSFGDGGSAPGVNLSYTYRSPGVYLAVFSVTDSAGDRTNATAIVTVNAAVVPTGAPDEGVTAISFYGILAAFVAAFAGALLYVRGHPLRFHSGPTPPRSPPGGDEAAPHAGPSPLPATPVGPETTAILPVVTRYRPEMYRGLFIDLSEQEFDVLTKPSEEEIREAPSPAQPDLPRIPLSQRIILHLLGQPQLGPDDIATGAYTQAGMVDALGVQQGPLSNVLRRLTYSGILRAELGHVQGSPRRLNVYRLTPKGEIVAVRLRDSQVGIQPVGGPIARKEKR
jgi:hypothetical protein